MDSLVRLFTLTLLSGSLHGQVCHVAYIDSQMSGSSHGQSCKIANKDSIDR